jgi:hypothetical protein
MFHYEVLIVAIVPAVGVRVVAIKHGYPHRLTSSEGNVRILTALYGWRIQSHYPMEVAPAHRFDRHGNHRVQWW